MKRIGFLMLASTAALALAAGDGTGSNAGWKGSSSGTVGKLRTKAPENGLVGIHLYDDGLKLVRIFGSPDEIQALGTGAQGGIGPAGGSNTSGAPGQSGATNGPQGSSAPTRADVLRPNDWGYQEFNMIQGNRGRQGGDEDSGLTGGGPQGGPVGGGQGPGPQGGGGAANNAGSRVLFTRWVYKRGNSRFGFILDKFNHVIQIEAIGSADSRVYTNRGIKYGSQVKDIINRYGAPDAYEIGGDQIVMRYLINSKVAFRLNRLKTDKPHVVTGIVVAAGKA